MIGLALVIAGPSLCSAQTTLTLGSAAESNNLGVFAGAGSFNNSGSLAIYSGSSYGNFGLGSGASFTNTGSAAFNHEYTGVSASALSSASSVANSLTQNGTFSNNTISGSGSLVVYDLSSINLSGSQKLTIQGNSSQTFIINVTGSGGIKLSGSASIALSGGVTRNHVLFNIVGGAVSFSGAGTVNGTFLDVSHGITNSGSTVVNGSLVGQDGVTNTGSLTINAGIFNADPIIATAPELPTIAISGIAFLLLIGKTGFDRMRRRRVNDSCST